MFQPLATAAQAFTAARADYIDAVKANRAEAAHEALADAIAAADALLTFIGLVEPYACGECAACKANAAVSEDEDTFRRLLSSVDFDAAVNPEESA